MNFPQLDPNDVFNYELLYTPIKKNMYYIYIYFAVKSRFQ